MSVATKACSICEEDLSGRKRVRDEAGNYYCPDCWEARNSFEATQPTAAATTSKLQSAKPQTLASGQSVSSPTPVRPVESSTTKWLVKVGMLVFGVGFFALENVRPMYKALQHSDDVSFSFKLSAFSWMMLFGGLFLLVAEQMGFPFGTGRPMSEKGKKRLKVASVVIGLLCAGLAEGVEIFIEHQGYQMRHWYDIDKHH